MHEPITSDLCRLAQPALCTVHQKIWVLKIKLVPNPLYCFCYENKISPTLLPKKCLPFFNSSCHTECIFIHSCLVLRDIEVSSVIPPSLVMKSCYPCLLSWCNMSSLSQLLVQTMGEQGIHCNSQCSSRSCKGSWWLCEQDRHEEQLPVKERGSRGKFAC